jgi:tungstate transport system substrate-binding protein
MSLRIVTALSALFVLLAGPAPAAERFIIVASTTSTENSGLFGHILPLFTGKTGIEVRVVAKGTGQAIRIAGNGDADVLLVHHRPSELAFVARGHGINRREVMYNDFVLVGPQHDPAGCAGLKDAAAAFAKIARARAVFASRGDDSGTNKAELGIWKMAGIAPQANSGAWYRETGSGMGATLNTAAAMDAYTLADRATWISFRNKRGLRVLVEGDPMLFNPYGVMLVNPRRFPHVKAEAGMAFINWLVSGEGQRAIASYRVDGRQLFFPNAE